MSRQGARAQATFVSATVDLRLQALLGPRADVERTDALGTVDFMGGKRHQVDRPVRQVNRHLARTLGGIDVEQGPVFTHALADGRDVVDGAQLIVDQHQRHQEGVLAQCLADRLRSDQPIGVGQQISDIDPGILQLPGRIENRLVFDLAGDDMPARLLTSLGYPLEGQVIGFSGTGGPDDLGRLRPHQTGDLLARQLDRTAGLLAKGMGTGGGVAEVAVETQTIDHHLDDPLIHRGGGGVIKI